jgi:hypothetical protein
VIERPPVAPAAAVSKLARCVLTTFWLLAEGRIHLPKRYVGLQLNFADGTAPKVYRETVVDRPVTADPVVFVVGFRLRAVRGHLAHALFRFESLFNTPLFVGFPGFVSKLWVAHDSNDVYRGSMNGTARRWPRTTCGHCGVCWHWYACQGQSTMRSCPASPERSFSAIQQR